MTKVFTALLLADMVQRGEVALENPIAKYLPGGTRIPEWNGQPITFLDVATHTSGLPLMPDGLSSLNELVTLKYSDAQLYKFLGQYELPRQNGTKWDYSNIGYSLLGKALAARAGVDYETLLRTRLIVPLELHNTGVMALGLRAKLAVGHDASLQPTPPLSTVPMLLVMAPAGAVLSTANDLLRLLRVAMGYERSPLAPAIAAMLSTRRPSPVGEQALGWMVEGKGDDQLIFHDGQFNGVGSEQACWGCRALQSPRTRRRRRASPAAPQPSSGEACRDEAYRDRPRFGGPRQLRWPIYLRGRSIHHHEGSCVPDDPAAS
jgi:serine-type D-Ala-D-Ala carboxypeptidase/endopeptidase